MNFFKDRFLILTLFLGLLIRLVLAPIAGFKFDVDTWFAWADRLNSVGFALFYSDQIWTSYPPGFLYILSFLGFIKNVFQIDTSFFYSILKFPSILAEIILAFLIYQIIPKTSLSLRRIGVIFIILNPAFIFNSSIFGQFDGLFSLTLLVSVYFLIQKKIIYSSVFAGISFLLKPQAVLLLPIFLIYIFKNFSTKNIFYLTSPALFTIVIGFLPFFINNPFNGPINLISNLLNYYQYNSIFAYNFWGIFGFWIPDNKTFFEITYQNWGYILFTFFWIVIGYFYFWKKKDLSLYTLLALSALSFFFLLTRMHERYLYPALVFLNFVAILKKSRLLLALSLILSLLHFLDLYYVYIYYNLFYLKLPAIIYNQTLYNFADENLKFISLISTIIFFLATINILGLPSGVKLNDESKNI